VRFWEKIRRECAHAFAITPSAGGFSPEDIALLEKVARLIVNRGMAAPAVLFLESLGPLNFLGSQVVHGLKPFLDFVTDAAEVERLAALLERRESVEQFSRLLQEQANSFV
jgi:hypothetical protein